MRNSIEFPDESSSMLRPACRWFLPCLIAASLAIASDVRFAQAAELVREKPPTTEPAAGFAPIYLWQETLEAPRTIVASLARIDLQNPDIKFGVMISDDPDGDGPAEAQLAMPQTYMQESGALVAVNASAFGAAYKEDSKKGYYLGLRVNVVGLVAKDGDVRSPAQEQGKRKRGEVALWQGADGKFHMNVPKEDAQLETGVGQFVAALVRNGKIVRRKDEAVHPRTAVGLDETGRFLTLVVIDGRQKVYSEGVTLYELAEFMQSHGCDHAINLDGGGSSIMMVRDSDTGEPTTYNRPSGGKHRPIPVMIGVLPNDAKMDEARKED